MAYKFQYADWVNDVEIKPFNRHDLEYSRQFLGQLRMMGRRRRVLYGTGHFSITRAQSSAMRSLTQRIDAGGVFLDAGCGDSPDADLALELGFSKAYAVDLFPRAKVINGYLKPFIVKSKAKFILGDICEQLPIADNSIDAISSNWVVPLMSSQDRLLFYKQVYRLLKPGGAFSLAADSMVSGYGHGELFAPNNERRRLNGLGFIDPETAPSGVVCFKPTSINKSGDE